MKDIQNEKGIALIMAILALVMFSILGLAIVTVTNQGQKQRDLSNEQIEGKMLADTGLLYFQKYLEKNLNFDDIAIQSALKSPSENDELQKQINKIYPIPGDPTITLPDGKGAFQIQYQIMNTIPYQDDNDSSKPYTQPYIRKLDVTVTGIPADTSHFKKVKLTATMYINTIASPFHYAISTPNELRLYGGSNIIGSVSANQLYASTQFYHSYYEKDQNKNIYTIEQDDPMNPAFNLPYVEGKVFLHGDPLNLYNVKALSPNDDGPPTRSVTDLVYTDRQSLQSIFFTLKSPEDVATTSNTPSASINVSAPVGKPYIPRSEPPLVESNIENINPGLSFNLNEYIKSQFQTIALQAGTKLFVNDNDQQQPIWIGTNGPVDGFKTDNSLADSDIAIYTEQSDNKVLPTNDPNAPPVFLLTARLTGNTISSPKRLFIGPDPNSNSVDYDTMNASVEMGKGSSFAGTSTEGCFTFNGSIFIKGDLDIVGDINVNGTIYVDGNVNIREVGGGTDFSTAPNLVILSTGRIIISNRNKTDNIEWSTVPRLSAFLYSDNYPIEIYSYKSVNWFYGGLATGTGDNNSDPKSPPPYIELNTKREQDSYASHMTIQFNRGIFEKETPGLPSANQFFIDTYDLNYSLNN